MSQWSLRERLQPSLLDRLVDENPDKTREGTADQFLDQSDLRAAVIRDLGFLLNCVALEVVYDLDAYPQVRDSVLNYGIPDLSGSTASTLDASQIEAGVKRAIRKFEPRLIRNSLKLNIHSNPNEMSANTLVFEIEGAVYGQPAPFQVNLRSELDLESGDIRLRDGS